MLPSNFLGFAGTASVDDVVLASYSVLYVVDAKNQYHEDVNILLKKVDLVADNAFWSIEDNRFKRGKSPLFL